MSQNSQWDDDRFGCNLQKGKKTKIKKQLKVLKIGEAFTKSPHRNGLKFGVCELLANPMDPTAHITGNV